MTGISEYIENSRNEGVEDAKIRQNLLEKGWKDSEISKHLNGNNSLNVPSPPEQKTSTGAHLWITFEYILMFISLYIVIFSIWYILFQLVGSWLLPDKTTGSYGYYSYYSYGSTEKPLAALIVSLPIFSVLFLHLSRLENKKPELRKLIARKILIYITMLINFIIILASLITLVSELLDGNVTTISVVRIFLTIFLTSLVFAYCISLVLEDKKELAKL